MKSALQSEGVGQATAYILTPRICVAPEYNRSVFVVGMAQYIVQEHGESVQVADMQWTKVGVEGII